MTAAVVIFVITIIFSLAGLQYAGIKATMCQLSNRPLEIWRPFTYTFVHSSWSHFLGNSFFYSLGFLGFFQKFSNIEFLEFYFLTSFISALPYFFKTSALIGNSAVINAILFGAVALSPFQNWTLLGFGLPAWSFGIFFIFLIYLSANDKRSALLAHNIGAVVGIFWIIYLK